MPFFAPARSLHGWTDRPTPSPFVPPPAPRPQPTPTPPSPSPTPGGPWQPTQAQLRAFQGNLAVYCPAVAPNFNADGYDPVLRIKNRDDQGHAPEGILAGWVWLNWLWRYPAQQRTAIYAAIKAAGGTHFQQNISVPDAGWQYHGLALVTEEDRANYGRIVSQILDEADAQRLVVIGSGLTPGYPIAPGIDPRRIRIAMNFWDDTAKLWDDLKACAASCPNALIYLELPGPRQAEDGSWVIHPDPCGGDEPVVPTPNNGGEWLRAAQRRFPNFLGVLHELDPNPDAIDRNVEYLTEANRFWRDVQQVGFEQFLYDVFWHNVDPSRNREAADEIMRRCPWLDGQMGGATPHAVVDGPSLGDNRPLTGRDEIPVEDVVFVGGPDIGAFARTATITKLELTRTGVHVEATKLDGPGRWIGRITDEQTGENFQFSLGLALKRDGRWYAAAPIEAWYGQRETGGQIQAQHIAGADKPDYGQIAQNWFNYSRFAPLQGLQPQPGDEIGFFICSGDARNNLCNENERSNIVTFRLPADGSTLSIDWK